MHELNNMGKSRKIHFIGIGGVGMSGIAEVLFNQGYQVTGSDIASNAIIARLQQLGLPISIGHSSTNVSGADVVVCSAAIEEDNPELAAARAKQIPILPRAQMLAELMRFRYGVAIAGTHGKTTTTSLVASILSEGGLDPTYVIGGVLNSVSSTACLGESQYLVTEADESDASFLHLQPMMSVITNIDADHMQTYGGDFSRLTDVFLDFIHQLPFYGVAIICIDDLVIAKLQDRIARPRISYGFAVAAQYRALDYQQMGLTSKFTVQRQGHADLLVELNLPGKHNALNALAAIAVATELGVTDTAISTALAKFSGVKRRLQVLGDLKLSQGHALLIDDYGHHPVEVTATVAALRAAFPDRRLVSVFQPHRYSRLRDLFEAFIESLSQVDLLLLLDVYAANETEIAGVNSRTLAGAIRQRGKVNPIYIHDSSQLAEQLQLVLQADDVVLMQGAGSISRMAHALLNDMATAV